MTWQHLLSPLVEQPQPAASCEPVEPGIVKKKLAHPSAHGFEQLFVAGPVGSPWGSSSMLTLPWHSWPTGSTTCASEEPSAEGGKAV